MVLVIISDNVRFELMAITTLTLPSIMFAAHLMFTIPSIFQWEIDFITNGFGNLLDEGVTYSGRNGDSCKLDDNRGVSRGRRGHR
jgi:hypothetical protein